MNAKTLTILIAVISLVVLLGFGLADKNEEAIAIGEPVPEMELVELSNGAEASLDDQQGKWVLLNMWSSWCGPCRTESPDLLAFQEAHPDKLVVVGVNIEDRLDHAQEFVAEFGLTYPQLRAADNRALIESFSIRGCPESFLIDPEGRFALIYRGPLTEELLRENVEPLLKSES